MIESAYKRLAKQNWQMIDVTIARAKAGEQAAAGKLYECYYERIFRYLTYRVGDVHTAEDLTEEVFLRMMRALPGYRQQQGTFQAWLFQIARNLAIDHQRRSSRRQLLPLTNRLQSRAESPEALAASSLNADLLRRALQQLTEAQMEVVILRVVAEMPIAEVAEALGRSENAVKGLQRRGLEALKDVLAEWGVSHD